MSIQLKSSAFALSERLKRVAAGALIANPFDVPPLVLPPAYANSTALAQGNVVTSGGNMFICAVAGTTAASGAPSFSNGALFTDGTAQLSYFGPVPRAADDPTAPSVSIVTTNPFLGLNWLPVNNPLLYRVRGGVPAAYRTNLWQVQTFVPALAAASVCRSAVIDTVVDETRFALFVPSNSGPIRLAIDDVFYSLSSWNFGGTDTWIVFDYAGKAMKKHRKLSVYTNRSISYFGGIQTTTAGQIDPPSAVDTVRLIECADSIGAGAGPGPWAGGNAPAIAFGSMVGIDDVWVMSTGSTGDIDTASGTLYNYAQRVTQIIAAAPDVVMLPISTNDLDETPAAVTAARTSTLQALRAGLPNAIIVNEGIWPIANGGNTAAVTALENAGKAAHDAVADRLMFWMPRATDTQPWLTSNNRPWNIAADAVHPPDNGSLYIARQRALSWRRLVLPNVA